ncbi:MAG: MFS transporter [Chloroflexota bacterium]|nr:MFS transporter [Chloroflexota bacterium]
MSKPITPEPIPTESSEPTSVVNAGRADPSEGPGLGGVTASSNRRPFTIELGPAGSPLGLGTVADFDAEADAVAQEPAGVVVPHAEAAVSSAAPAAPPTRGWVGSFITAPLLAVGRRLLPLDQPLLQEESFRIYWLARIMAQTGQGALLYALLIIVIDRTDASFFSSLFVICSILPSIAFGLPGGIVVDALPRRALLVGLNLVRFAFMLFLMARDPSLPGIFAATLGIWTIHQFYSPTEGAALAALVPREQYVAAQALSNLALTLAQLLGLVILAPLLLKTAGPRTLFAVCGALFAVAAGLAALLPRMDEHLAQRRKGRANRASGGRERRPTGRGLLGGWHAARSDRLAYEALADDVLVGIGMSSLVVIMPFYLERVLDTAKENTVFVFAPSALGLVLGLRLAPTIGHIVGERRTATMSLIGFAACVAALGFVRPLHDLLDHRLGLPIDPIADLVGIPRLVAIAMLLSIPAGFASALVSVTARSVLLARTPPALRGQVVATQALINNIGALVPTLLAGIAADLVGVEPIAVAIAVVIFTGALAAHTVSRRAIPLVSPSG